MFGWDIVLFCPSISYELIILEGTALYHKMSKMEEKQEFYFQQFLLIDLKSSFYIFHKSDAIYYWDDSHILCLCLTATCKNYADTSVGKNAILQLHSENMGIAFLYYYWSKKH